MPRGTIAITEQQVEIDFGNIRLNGDLALPEGAAGLVIFAHGSGSGRHSPRNRFVAQRLTEVPMGTLLLDLLTGEEERIDEYTRHLRFDIDLLAGRVVGVIDWAAERARLANLKVGVYGASTGAAAALVAAARRPERVSALVSRGGRADLAGDALGQVHAPTLLIVGGDDLVVLELNRQAVRQMRCETQLEIIHGATHLFEEPGAREEVSELTADWFAKRIA